MVDEQSKQSAASRGAIWLAIVVFLAGVFLLFPNGRTPWAEWSDRRYAREHGIATTEEAQRLISAAKVSPREAHALASQVFNADPAYQDNTSDGEKHRTKLIERCFFVVAGRYFIPLNPYSPSMPRPHANDRAGEPGYYVDMQTGQVTAGKDGPTEFPWGNALYYKDLK